MIGPQRFFANDRNLIATATLSASSVKPVAGTVSETSRVADGYGTISLSGSYTGANDATIDVVITAGGSATHISTPEFTGKGNGVISAISATGISSRTISVECTSTGIAGQTAKIHLGEVLVKAVAAGTAGDGINMEVATNLVLGEKIGAIPKQINAGETGWSGSEWDLEQQPITDTGELPASALRVVINRDMAHVYRLYKTWDGQNWRYNMTPPAAQQYRYGASVHLVTGDYTVTVSQTGQTTEVYSGHTTLYSLLNAMLASNLIDIDGAVVDDRRPAGMGILDVPWRTAASAQIINVQGSEYVQQISDMAVIADSVTQDITIRCTNNGVIGKETWAVFGSVSGELPEAITGTLYDEAVLGFTIPQFQSITTGNEIQISGKTYVARTGEEIKPDLCLKGAILGRKAIPQSIRYTFTLREQDPCECANVAYTGALIPSLLGIDEEAAVSEPDAVRIRIDDIYSVYRQIVDNTTYHTAPTESGTSPFRSYSYVLEARIDGDLITRSCDYYEIRDALEAYQRQGYAVTSAQLWLNNNVQNGAFWRASTFYAVNTVVFTTVGASKFRAIATIGGITGAIEPTWSASGSIVDGAVTWTVTSAGFSSEWDSAHGWIAATPVNQFDWFDFPAAVGGANLERRRRFYCAQAGTTGVKMPDFADTYNIGDVVSDNTVLWRYLGNIALSGSVYAAQGAGNENAKYAAQLLGIAANCLREVYVNEEALAEWDLLWTEMKQVEVIDFLSPMATSYAVHYSANYLEKYNAWVYQIQRLAGLNPGKFDAGLTGNAVWQDQNVSHWWVAEDERYLPMFTNVYYHTAIRNANGDPESTMEAGFALTCGCPESLKAGDTVTIAIGSQEKTYLRGDAISIAITGGTSLITAGGITAVDTITWRVGPGFADYALTSVEPAYSNGGLAFQINRGGIPFAPGDKFYFDVENSLQFKWRKDAGSWSADTAIAATVALTNGLSAVFTPGVAPSWVAGDAWSFSVIQPYSPNYVKTPLPLDFGWQWSTSGETLSVDLGSTQTITAVGILVHSLPAGATLALWGGSTAGATDWTEPLVWRTGPILGLFSAAHSSRYLRLVIGSATGGSVGWVWVGQPLTVSKPGGVTQRRYEHRMVRDGGINPGARRLGSGWGATVEWRETMGWLTQTDADALLSMIENCKANNDSPIVFLPTYLDTTEGMLVRIADDEIEIIEQSGHQPVDAKRRINMSIEMTPVLS